MSQSSLGSRFSRGSIVGFGLWTLLAQGTALAGGTPRQLGISVLLLMMALLAGFAAKALYQSQKGSTARSHAGDPPRTTAPPTPEKLSAWQKLIPFFLSFVMLALAGFAAEPEILAGALAIIATGILMLEIRRPPLWISPSSSPRAERGLLILAILIAFITASAHRPDADDAMYVNIATTAADFPDRTLLSFDGSLTESDIPLPEAAYRSHTLEILAGILARATGFSPISLLHIAFAFWATLLAVFAQAELQKIFWPRQWLLGTIFAILILFALGEGHRGYGNFAFVRIHQGKGILLAAVLPMMIASGFHYMRTPTGRNWCVLLLAMVASTGVSSTGIVIAPVALIGVLVASSSPDRKSAQAMFCGLLTALYPVALAMLLGVL